MRFRKQDGHSWYLADSSTPAAPPPRPAAPAGQPTGRHPNVSRAHSNAEPTRRLTLDRSPTLRFTAQLPPVRPAAPAAARPARPAAPPPAQASAPLRTAPAAPHTAAHAPAPAAARRAVPAGSHSHNGARHRQGFWGPWRAVQLAFLGLAMLFFGLFFTAYRSYRQTETLYQTLSTQVLQSEPAAGAAAADAPAGSSRVDFAALAAINPDIVAWVELPGLEQSLPVVQGADNTTYLHRRFDGTEGSGGCLFLDASAPTGAAALHQVVFGHNLHTGSMFGRLPDYLDADFYARFPTFRYDTPEGDFVARIFSVYRTTTDDALYDAHDTAGADYDAFLVEIKAASAFDTGVTPSPGSRVLTLSTCASPYAANQQRVVLHAVLEPVA